MIYGTSAIFNFLGVSLLQRNERTDRSWLNRIFQLWVSPETAWKIKTGDCHPDINPREETDMQSKGQRIASTRSLASPTKRALSPLKRQVRNVSRARIWAREVLSAKLWGIFLGREVIKRVPVLVGGVGRGVDQRARRL
ncbi:hypothetical protein C0Q70_13727 [Pomacea canaliculata]|uniref:Uncharacterized protein n=1 Tax=Pomacea canaliculata TaxID=400727 RepID=A0A2T7NY18_POMCA|nr:hypothetical protein C0Q70_13727 [Pomacea canaliculata]